MATTAPVVDFLLAGGGAVGGASALGASVGVVFGSVWSAAGREVHWPDWIGMGGGAGGVFGLGVLLWAVLTGNLT